MLADSVKIGPSVKNRRAVPFLCSVRAILYEFVYQMVVNLIRQKLTGATKNQVVKPPTMGRTPGY